MRGWMMKDKDNAYARVLPHEEANGTKPCSFFKHCLIASLLLYLFGW